MKKKKGPKKPDDKNLHALLKAIQKDIDVMKNDVKMIKIDVVLKDSHMGLSFRGLTREIEQTNKEVKKMQSDVDNLVAQIVTLDEKIDGSTEAIHAGAKQYRDDLMRKLDSIAADIKTSREEQTILAYRQSNHGQRIEKLESSVFGKSSD